jgi:hypothetical protein
MIRRRSRSFGIGESGDQIICNLIAGLAAVILAHKFFSMADLNLMRRLYSGMPDEQLLFRAIHEKKDMTPEAIGIMEEEIIKRGLDIDAARAAEMAQQHQNKKWEHLTGTVAEEFVEKAWRVVLDEKSVSTPDSDIIYLLVQQGFSPEMASMFVLEAAVECRRRLDKYDAYIFYGGSAFVVGIIANILVRRAGGIMFVGWGLILAGFVTLLMGLSRRGKYASLLKLFKKDS